MSEGRGLTPLLINAATNTTASESHRRGSGVALSIVGLTGEAFLVDFVVDEVAGLFDTVCWLLVVC